MCVCGWLKMHQPHADAHQRVVALAASGVTRGRAGGRAAAAEGVAHTHIHSLGEPDSARRGGVGRDAA